MEKWLCFEYHVNQRSKHLKKGAVNSIEVSEVERRPVDLATGR